MASPRAQEAFTAGLARAQGAVMHQNSLGGGRRGSQDSTPSPPRAATAGTRLPAPCPQGQKATRGVRAADRPWDQGFLGRGLGWVGAVPTQLQKLGSCAFFEGCKQNGLNAVQKLSARVLFWEQGRGAVPFSAFGATSQCRRPLPGAGEWRRVPVHRRARAVGVNTRTCSPLQCGGA